MPANRGEPTDVGLRVSCIAVLVWLRNSCCIVGGHIVRLNNLGRLSRPWCAGRHTSEILPHYDRGRRGEGDCYLSYLNLAHWPWPAQLALARITKPASWRPKIITYHSRQWALLTISTRGVQYLMAIMLGSNVSDVLTMRGWSSRISDGSWTPAFQMF